jgi:phosphatidylserine/phosphatidylglycerophosphate/cardiolipin synthase-like enzyme
MFTKNSFFVAFLFFAIVGFFNSFYIPLPKKNNPILIYPNDLAFVYAMAIRRAKNVIATSFGFDHTLKPILERKKSVLFLDAGQKNALLNQETYFLQSKGFYHPKCLLLDDHRVFISTANLTKNSLFFSNNVCIGLFHPMLCHKLKQALFTQTPLYFSDNHLTLFYKNSKQAKAHLLQFLQAAKKSIELAMFTLTDQALIDALIALKARGIKCTIYLDKHPANKKALVQLKEAQVEVFVSTKKALLHTKMALCDDQKLYVGSANWTKRGFSKNHELLLFINDLKKQDLRAITKHLSAL